MKEKLSVIAMIITAVLLVGLVGYGYVHNITLLTDAWDGPLTAKLVLRVIGIPAAPIGVIMGYVP